MTGKPSRVRQTGQDIPQEPEALLGCLEAEASSGHDEESGALTGSLSNRFHLCDREAGESPRTRPTRLD